MQDSELRQLYSLTANHLRSLQGQMASLEATNEKVAEENARLLHLERARKLAAQSAERGYVDRDFESVEKQAQDFASEEDLDPIERSLRMSAGYPGLPKTAEDDEGMGGQRGPDPITAILTPYMR
jgi:hypothetical protein